MLTSASASYNALYRVLVRLLGPSLLAQPQWGLQSISHARYVHYLFPLLAVVPPSLTLRSPQLPALPIRQWVGQIPRTFPFLKSQAMTSRCASSTSSAS